MKKLSVFLAIIFIAGAYSAAIADTLYVPDDRANIDLAIAATRDGDVVVVEPGVYRGQVDFRGRDIVVGSLYLTTGDDRYITETIIDAQREGRAVSFENGEPRSCRLTGFTIINGFTSYGAGLYISESQPTVDHCIITECEAENRGGGIYCRVGSQPLLLNITVSGNEAVDGNGGIHAFGDNVNPTIINSIFWGNVPDQYAEDRMTATYSCLRDGQDVNGQGNIIVDPLFADEDDGDFHITWENFPQNDNTKSPCIDRGDPDSPEDPDETRADMGALHFSQEPQRPEILVGDDELDFGPTGVGMSNEMILNIRNVGEEDLEIESIVSDNEAFTVDNDGNIILEPDDGINIRVTFTPEEEGNYEGALTITSNDEENEEVSVDLFGDGMAGFLIEMVDGWNMISAPIEPFDDDIVNICDQLTDDDNLIIIKDYRGRFYWPAENFNNIPAWIPENGYQIKLEQEDSLRILGEFVPEDQPIELAEGYTIAAYFPEQPVDVVVACENILDRLILVKDAFGRFYLHEYEWGNLEPLERGQGYKIKVSEAVELVWNTEENVNFACNSESNMTPPVHYVPGRRSGASMSILVNTVDILGDGAELGVFTSNGLCVGSVNLENCKTTGFAVWGDDPTTAELDGALAGVNLTFRLWKDDAESVPEISVIHDSYGDSFGTAIQYRTDEFSVIEVRSSNLTPSGFGIYNAHPNPFNGEIKISYRLIEASETTLSIYDTKGRNIDCISSGFRSAGSHAATYNAVNLASGVYFIKLTSANAEEMRKVILLR